MQMVTVNKAVLISSPIPIFFLFCQLSIAVVLLLLCRTLRLLSLPAWNTNTALRLWPLIAVNVLGLIFNNLCLQYVDASFYQIARGLVLPITVVLSFAMQSSPPSMHATLCCVGITLGFAVGVMYDNHASARAGQMHTSL
jgi:GDP-fucose transporter C1